MPESTGRHVGSVDTFSSAYRSILKMSRIAVTKSDGIM